MCYRIKTFNDNISTNNLHQISKYKGNYLKVQSEMNKSISLIVELDAKNAIFKYLKKQLNKRFITLSITKHKFWYSKC